APDPPAHDDSTLDKPYARKIELVGWHWSGKHRDVVRGRRPTRPGERELRRAPPGLPAAGCSGARSGWDQPSAPPASRSGTLGREKGAAGLVSSSQGPQLSFGSGPAGEPPSRARRQPAQA